jgi:hypothetical protein
MCQPQVLAFVSLTVIWREEETYILRYSTPWFVSSIEGTSTVPLRYISILEPTKGRHGLHKEGGQKPRVGQYEEDGGWT